MVTMPKELFFTHDGKECKAILVDKGGSSTSSTAQCFACQESLHDRPFYTTSPHFFDVHVDCARGLKIIERFIPAGDEPAHFVCPSPLLHGHVSPSPPPPPPPPPPHRSMEFRSSGPPPYYGQNAYYSYLPNNYYAPYYGNWGLQHHYPQQPSYYYPPNYYYAPPPIYHPPQLQGFQQTPGLGRSLGIAAFSAFLQALFTGDLSPWNS